MTRPSHISSQKGLVMRRFGSDGGIGAVDPVV
jgi:hypothetical protein